jgi:tripartite-type tricarboxylate transporter receptor subunit TctC
MAKALASPETLQRLAEQGIDAAPMSPEQFGTFIKAEVAKWARSSRKPALRRSKPAVIGPAQVSS